MKRSAVLLVLVIGLMAAGKMVTLGERVSQSYMADIELILQRAEALKETTESGASWEEQRTEFRSLRMAYKRIEFLVAYADPQLAGTVLNGAPLPRLEPKASGIVVLQPQGLQRLEELYYDEAVSDAERAAGMRQFVDAMELLDQYAKHHYFTDRKLFESVRQGLVRVLSMGITGFDTPMSDLAIEESAVALRAMSEVMRGYEAELKAIDPDFTAQYLNLWNRAVDFISTHSDFETFPRGQFTRVYLEPLFAQTLDAQSMLHVEFKDETTSMVQYFNHRSEHVFSDDLINPYAFTQMRESEYSAERSALGKMLFFDPILSINAKRACASCHQPSLAFSDTLSKSMALNFAGTVDRNAPTLVNAIYSPRFFWDLRTERLETQFAHVIFNPDEFDMTYVEIISRLNSSDEYKALFEEAFGKNQNINRRAVETAIASYLVTLRSFNSPVDQWLRGEGEVSAEVEAGYDLFMGKAACGTCHFAPTFAGLVPPYFSDMESEVLGVPADSARTRLDADLGRRLGLMKERSEIYNHSFKTITVRNVALTAPYMHNGVFATLEEVVDFYNRGGGTGHGFDVPNQTLPFDSLGLSETEERQIVAFMRALTDTTGMTSQPSRLPEVVGRPEWASRKSGGEY